MQKLTDGEWDKIKDFLPGQPGKMGRPARNTRRFIDAVLWKADTGKPWSAMPKKFGPLSGTTNRFYNWRNIGVWDKVVESLAGTESGTAIRKVAIVERAA